jgi:hypothetical protein
MFMGKLPKSGFLLTKGGFFQTKEISWGHEMALSQVQTPPYWYELPTILPSGQTVF